MNLQNGYLSGRSDRVEVSGLGCYSLDSGQLHVDLLRPVMFRAGPLVCILLP